MFAVADSAEIVVVAFVASPVVKIALDDGTLVMFVSDADTVLSFGVMFILDVSLNPVVSAAVSASFLVMTSVVEPIVTVVSVAGSCGVVVVCTVLTMSVEKKNEMSLV